MQESVQGGGSHDAVTSEDMTPVAEGFVGGDDGGGLFFITLPKCSCNVSRDVSRNGSK